MSLPEEDLIKSRPLLFESRPFSRIPKRTSLPANTTHALIDSDFLPLLTSLTRLQLLQATTAAEIARYTESASAITELSQRARETLTSLHADLAAAQAEKQNRLQYDEIVESFLSTTKEREETEGAIRRLREECEELEREAKGYEEVWEGRKKTFEGIVEQLEMMWKQIKEEKEEHERREGMSEGDGEGDERDGDADKEEREEGEEVEVEVGGDVRMDDVVEKDSRRRDREKEKGVEAENDSEKMDVDRMDTS